MLRFLRQRKAQNTAEYAIMIGVIVAVAIAMQVYIKRGLQGRVKEAVDHVGQGGVVGGSELGFSGTQYEPYYLQSDSTSTGTTIQKETVAEGGGVTRALEKQETQRTGYQRTLAPEEKE